jgi:hypothetical protein
LPPPLANFFTHAPGLRVLAKRIAGVANEREIPKLAHRGFLQPSLNIHTVT